MRRAPGRRWDGNAVAQFQNRVTTDRVGSYHMKAGLMAVSAIDHSAPEYAAQSMNVGLGDAAMQRPIRWRVPGKGRNHLGSSWPPSAFAERNFHVCDLIDHLAVGLDDAVGDTHRQAAGLQRFGEIDLVGQQLAVGTDHADHRRPRQPGCPAGLRLYR